MLTQGELELLWLDGEERRLEVLRDRAWSRMLRLYQNGHREQAKAWNARYERLKAALDRIVSYDPTAMVITTSDNVGLRRTP